MSDENFDEKTEDYDDDGEWVDDIPVSPEPDITEISDESEDLETLESESVTVFPEKWKQKFEGLAYVGYLEEEIDIPMHKFVVRTLLAGEKIEVSQIASGLEGKIGYNRAYKAAIVGAGLVSVDGEKILIAERERGAVRQKYEYVINVWHDMMINIMYHHINRLEGQVIDIMRELGFFDNMEPDNVKKDNN